MKSWFGIDLILEGTRSDFDAQQQYLYDVLHFLLSILLVGLVQHVVAPHEASWQSKTEVCKTFFCQLCFWLLGTSTAAEWVVYVRFHSRNLRVVSNRTSQN